MPKMTVEQWSEQVFEKVCNEALIAARIEIALDPANPELTDDEKLTLEAGVAIGAAMAVKEFQARGWLDSVAMGEAYLEAVAE